MALEDLLRDYSNRKLPAQDATVVMEPKTIDVETPYNPQTDEVSSRLSSIKSVFSLNPQQAPQAPAPQQQAPAPTPAPQMPEIDVAKVRQQVAASSPKLGWADFLPAAAPIVAELLTGRGGGGVSLQNAGNYLLQEAANRKKNDQTLESKLLDLEKSRAIAAMKTGKGSDKLYEAMGADGKPIWMTREQAIGSSLVSKDGKDAKSDLGERKFQYQREKDERKFGMDLRKELEKQPHFLKARTRYAATNDAINLLNQKNPIADPGVQIIFAKGIFGEVGNLTAQEQAKFAGSPAFDRAWDRMLEKYTNGTLGWADRKDLLDLAAAMRDASKDTMRNEASKYTKSSLALGYNPENVFAPLLDTSDIPPMLSDEIKSMERKNKDSKTLWRATKTPEEKAKLMQANERVKVKDRYGNIGTIPRSQLAKALKNQFTVVEEE